jgi:hypothetical protein
MAGVRRPVVELPSLQPLRGKNGTLANLCAALQWISDQ